jgi:hypothetical protein
MMELAAAMATMPKKSGTRPMGGQSAYSAPRSPMGMQPTTGGVNVSNKAFINAIKAQAVKGMPTGMFSRPPVIANKARGTMSSANRAAMGGI